MDDKHITQALDDIAQKDTSYVDLWPAIQAEITEGKQMPSTYKETRSIGMRTRMMASLAAVLTFTVLGGLFITAGVVFMNRPAVQGALVESIEPTPTMIPSTPVPPPMFDITHPEAAAVVAEWYNLTMGTPDSPIRSQTTAKISLPEGTAEEIRYWGEGVFVIVQTLPTGSLNTGELLIIDGRDARLVTGLSGEASRDIQSLQDGTGTLTEMRGGGFNDILETISYTDGQQILWMQGDQLVSVTGNIPFDDLLAFARFHMQDADNSVLQVAETVPIATTANAERSPIWQDGYLLYIESDAADNNEFVMVSVSEEGITERSRSATGQNNSFPQWAANSGEILFTSLRSGGGDIYVMLADYTNVRQLTSHPAFDGGAVWSPSAKQIAFYSDRDGQRAIYTMNGDGSNLQRITPEDEQFIYRDPQWSPDGSQLLLFRSTEQGEGGAVIVNADGSHLRLIAERAYSAQWSPDGSRIVYTSNVEGQDEIYTVSSTNPSDIQRITEHTATDYAPTWSPDGTQIAFVSDRGGDYDIYIVPAIGGEPINVTGMTGNELFPVWSPDGQRIVYQYQQGRTSNTDLYMVILDK